ncbi:uncharacterized protein LOC122497697 isoform X1 [Leptopilina heterotoma]|uniref:uncharacterized protein LOC122497697 isoform X1 n=1 Tax=Leptopilina heterotoma TaxID=63436 RepID=UPI001CA8DB67|nr:uncharacterized protein LOC122497697 isoform X1 [Leptopilina heterotoma]
MADLERADNVEGDSDYSDNDVEDSATDEEDDDDDDDDEEVVGDDDISEEDPEEIPADNDEDGHINDNENVEMEIDNNQEAMIVNPQVAYFTGWNIVGMRVPLQYNQNVSAVDILMLSLAQFIRHKSTYEQLISILKGYKLMFRHINIPTTKDALWRVLGRTGENTNYRFFCSQCKDEVGEGMVRVRCRCGRCGPDENETFIAVYVQILLRPQITDLLQLPNMAEALRYKYNRIKLDEEAVEDIYDGEQYKLLSEPGGFLENPNNFSFTLWTDGLKLTKSSRASTYPVVLQLNELSPFSRKKNLLLAGLWVSDEHPATMNTILRPTVNELRDLYVNGIRWRPDGGEEVTSKFIITTLTADSPAKSDVLRAKRYNGENGCPACLAPGETVDNRRVYAAEEYEMRRDDTFRHDALQAIARGTPVNGIKGFTALARLPHFDLVDGVVVDPAHNPFLGVAKRLVERFVSDVDDPWYIGTPDQKAIIDERILTIKPPSRISRSPRSINTYRMWKISEWRNWLQYYALPCLHNILPQEYFDHLTSLCVAINILNSSSISHDKFNTAKDLIAQFVKDYQRLYGLRHMLFNVHILNHLVQSVENWGPLWVFSALPFESLNKNIVDFVKSPHHRADQITTRFFMKKFISVAPRLMEIDEGIRNEVNHLLKIKHHHIEGTAEGNYYLAKGRTILCAPTNEEVRLVRQAGFRINPAAPITRTNKATIHGTEYRRKDNLRRKFCNSIAYCKQSPHCDRTTFYEISTIFSYFHYGETVAGIVGKRIRSNGDAYGTPHMQYASVMEEKEFVTYSNIISPGFLLPSTNNDLVVVPLSNVWETD